MNIIELLLIFATYIGLFILAGCLYLMVVGVLLICDALFGTHIGRKAARELYSLIKE